MNWKKLTLEFVMGAIIGCLAVICVELALTSTACTSGSAGAGLGAARDAAPVLYATPAAPVAGAVDGILASMQSRLSEIVAHQQETDAKLVAAGNAPKGDKLGWQDWLYIALGVGGAAAGTGKIAATRSNNALTDLATAVAASISAAKAGASSKDIALALTNALPGAHEVDHADVVAATAEILPAKAA